MLAGDAGVAMNTAVEVGAEDTRAASTTNDAVQSTSSSAIVFVDSAIENIDTLIDGLAQDSELVLLTPDQDAIAQVSNVLSSRSDVSQIHIITHGDAGQLRLGGQTIDALQLEQRSEEIMAWRSSLSDDADILLYGCNTGQGSAGAHFVSLLSKLSGADVAASNNLTGDIDQNGDWILEVQSGRIESLLAFDAVAQNHFQHTLDISIDAFGSTGEEVFELLIDGQAVQSWTATTDRQSYTYATDGNTLGSQVAVRFTNDLYQPEIGFDRNLVVGNVTVEDRFFETTASNVFSTGTWLDADGIQPGFGRGNTLHANGVFELRSPLEFGGATWTSNTPSADFLVQDDQLFFAATEEASAWRTADAEAGSVYRFTVDGVRSFLSEDQRPFASVGVDFRDANGDEIGEQVIDVNNETFDAKTVELVAPEGTTSATIWVWMEGPSSGTSEILLNEVSLEQIDLNNDTEQPTANMPADQVPNINRGSLSFVVDYADDQRLGQPASLRVTGPNGFDQSPVTFSGIGNGITNQRLLHGLFSDNGRDWGPEDNGIYTVELLPGTLTDQAGNVAPGQILGTFTVDIGSENDTVAPTATLLTESTTVVGNEVLFSLAYQDNESTVRFVNDPNVEFAVNVTGPNGYQHGANGFAGGPGDLPNQTVELFLLPPGPNGFAAGEYFVTISDNVIVDIAGNVLPSQLLGSFFLNV